MPGYDRPYFESPRERSFRERDLPSSRRGSDDEDDRGPWISRDRGGLLETVGDWLGMIGRRTEGDLERFKKFIEQRGVESGAYRGTIPSRDHR